MNNAMKIPTILLPNNSVDKTKWAVVACDQYTSEPEYWENVEKEIGNMPSTYNLMLPETYLEEKDVNKRIEKINNTMEEYISNGILTEKKNTLVLVRRYTKNAPVRTGIMLALDLENYDFRKGATSLIRSTEGTVEDRIPPRMKIRENAVIEMPHIMVLIDDPDFTVIEPIEKYALKNIKPAYDFDLMALGGHLTGYEITETKLFDQLNNALDNLADKNPLLYAVGDGNHSLASAKCHWDKIKKDLNAEELNTHPARYALCEIVNIHDEGIIFEPIHRVLFGVNTNELFDCLEGYFEDKVSVISFPSDSDSDILETEDAHCIPYITEKEKGAIYIDKSIHTLAVGALQSFLDYYLGSHSQTKIDYIHGDNVVIDKGCKKGNIGFILPAINKFDFFKSIIKNGPMPRKTFSLGEASEKRYYMECRKIK